MARKEVGARVVYSSARGPVCPKCGWPADGCRCAETLGVEDAVPTVIVAKLRIESKARGGKTVTVVDGLPRNSKFLEALARDLKKTCATGGAIRDGAVELQGDRRELLRKTLTARGYRVKG